MTDTQPVTVPRHVAIIMDGNGRWAEAQGLPRVAGHEEGANSVREIVRACRRLGVEALTLYSFSTENWKRPRAEVGALMALLQRYVLQEREEIMGNGIRLRAIGEIDRLPVYVRTPLKALMRESRSNDAMTLNLALSYGSRAEIVAAVRDLARDIERGRLSARDIDESVISAMDAVIVVTSHSAFDWDLIARNARCVVDTRNALGEKMLGDPRYFRA